MGTERTAPELTPRTYRFTDIDEFRSSVSNLAVEFTPLVRRISAEQTVLNLAGCSINLTRSFPRIIDGSFAPNCTAIGFTMDDGIPIRFNGVEREESVVVIGSHGAAYSSVETVERQYASIVFTPVVENRGWPKAPGIFEMFETSPVAHVRLREVVRQALFRAPQLASDIDANEASRAIRESLLAAVDLAFASAIPVRSGSQASASRQFKLVRDVDAVLSSSISHPIYSEELSRQIGAPVRSVHDAIQRFRGMSLHRYLRLRRLWLVRKRLLEGAESVKACALAFGFWHLGDFSAGYHAQFGETPSETMQRSAGHRRE